MPDERDATTNEAPPTLNRDGSIAWPMTVSFPMRQDINADRAIFYPDPDRPGNALFQFLVALDAIKARAVEADRVKWGRGQAVTSEGGSDICPRCGGFSKDAPYTCFGCGNTGSVPADKPAEPAPAAPEPPSPRALLRRAVLARLTAERIDVIAEGLVKVMEFGDAEAIRVGLGLVGGEVEGGEGGGRS